jgi:hypothetical protein
MDDTSSRRLSFSLLYRVCTSSSVRLGPDRRLGLSSLSHLFHHQGPGIPPKKQVGCNLLKADTCSGTPAVNDFIAKEDFPTRIDMAPAMAELVSFLWIVLPFPALDGIPPRLFPPRLRAVWVLFTGNSCSSWIGHCRSAMQPFIFVSACGAGVSWRCCPLTCWSVASSYAALSSSLVRRLCGVAVIA